MKLQCDRADFGHAAFNDVRWLDRDQDFTLAQWFWLPGDYGSN